MVVIVVVGIVVLVVEVVVVVLWPPQVALPLTKPLRAVLPASEDLHLQMPGQNLGPDITCCTFRLVPGSAFNWQVPKYCVQYLHPVWFWHMIWQSFAVALGAE